MSLIDLNKFYEIEKKKNYFKVDETNPDPILIAREKKDPIISLSCSLFAYGKASLIVKFLRSIDFEILNCSEEEISNYFKTFYYRFQNSEDVKQFFITLKRLKNSYSLEELFLEGYKKENFVIDGIDIIIKKLYQLNSYSSKGYNFLIGSPYKGKTKSSTPYKRWNMFLRWMVRDDDIDFGIWKRVKKSDLIIPLDTHTFNVSREIGLLKRGVYDLESAILLTEKLKEFDSEDPIKFDFVIYRFGQNRGVV